LGGFLLFSFLIFNGLHFLLVICFGIDSTVYGDCHLYKRLGNDEEYNKSYEAFKGTTKWLLIVVAAFLIKTFHLFR
jgi:hypothetical protein